MSRQSHREAWDDDPGRPEAIRNLYRVFSVYRGSPEMPFCDCCATREEIEQLFARPLSQLDPGDFGTFSNHVALTVGETNDFKHFLPRIFEVMVYADNSPMGPESLIGRLDYVHWRTWPQAEQEALSAFFLAWFRHVLAAFPAEYTAEDCLAAIAQAQDDLSPMLDHWRVCLGAKEEAALRHLAGVFDWNYGDLMQTGDLSGVYWEDHPGPRGQFREWLTAPLTGRLLEAGFFRFQDAPFAKELSDALQQFGWVREAMGKKG